VNKKSNNNQKALKAKIYIATIIIVGLVFFAFSIYLAYYKYQFNLTNSEIIVFIILLIARFLSEIFPIEYFPEKENHAEITVSIALTILIAFIFKPFYAILIIIITEVASNIFARKEWYKTIFNALFLSIVTGATSLVFSAFYNYSLSFFTPKNLVVVTLAGALNFFLETGILFGLLSILNKKQFLNFWFKNIKQISLEIYTLYPLGFLLIYLYTVNFWSAVLLIPVFFAIYAASQEKIEIIKQTEKTLYALVKLEENKFQETREHSERVSNLTALLCKKLGIGESDTEVIVKAAKLHDIGKISVPDYIVQKPEALNAQEWEWIKAHPGNGYELLKGLSTFKSGAEIIKYHHERWNGTGYPEKLKGKQIPLGARIIAIVDSFDAAISPRVYKKTTKSIKTVLNEFIEDSQKPDSERKYDKEIIGVFVSLIKELVNNKNIMENEDERLKYFPKQSRVE
jgi:putative nucleotidyltransferase with HDIG domain